MDSKMENIFLCAVTALFGVTAMSAQATDHPGIEGVLVSGTLPVLYIDTENGAVIDQKETYLQATYYLDNIGLDGVESIGSDTDRLPLEIRGRGNASWSYDKKPYKLKFESKTAILGMPKHKHFVLLSHTPMQEYYQERVSFKLAELMDFCWVPRHYPVEVVLNGRSIGFYNLCESVKIDKNRLNIYEQPDLNTDSSTVDSGWLVEIDNYDDEYQIKVQQPSGQLARFTHKTPEELTDLQRNWLIGQFENMTEAIYCDDKSSTEWEEYIDINSLAKYYIVQELTYNWDAFTGSTYMHKDTGEKWKFGPIWDSGWTFGRNPRDSTFVADRRKYSYEGSQFTWIEELWKFPRFRKVVKEEWDAYKDKVDDAYAYLDELHDRTSVAINLSYDSIWPQYKPDWTNLDNIKNGIRQSLPQYKQWFDNYILTETTVSINDIIADKRRIQVTVEGGAVRVVADGEIKTVSFHDMFGRPCRFERVGDDLYQIDCSSGLYILQVVLTDGTKIAKTVRI